MTIEIFGIPLIAEPRVPVIVSSQAITWTWLESKVTRDDELTTEIAFEEYPKIK